MGDRRGLHMSQSSFTVRGMPASCGSVRTAACRSATTVGTYRRQTPASSSSQNAAQMPAGVDVFQTPATFQQPLPGASETRSGPDGTASTAHHAFAQLCHASLPAGQPPCTSPAVAPWYWESEEAPVARLSSVPGMRAPRRHSPHPCSDYRDEQGRVMASCPPPGHPRHPFPSNAQGIGGHLLPDRVSRQGAAERHGRP